MNLPFLAGVAFALFSAYMLLHAIRNLRLASRSRDWPTVEGRIESARLWGRRNIDGAMRDVEHLSISYSYTVDGQPYASSAVALYTIMFPETVELADRFPVGARVDVHVDPADPSRSVLVAGPNPARRNSDLILASGALVVATAVAVMGQLGLLD